MADARWPEVEQAWREKRHELVLTGKDLALRVETGGLDDAVYSLKNLNFLEVSRLGVKTMSPTVKNLTGLTSLVFHHNNLESLPAEIAGLTKLKLLDLSGNKLRELPAELGNLAEVHSMNLNCNELEALPDLTGMKQLHLLDVSHNQLSELPEGLTGEMLEYLAEVRINNNKLTELPSDIAELPALKLLDIQENQITELPPELGEAAKLKNLIGAGNKLSDRRLGKLVNQGDRTKAVLDYLRATLQKQQQGGKGKGKDKGKKKKKKGGQDEMEDLSRNLMRVLKFDDSSEYSLTVTPEALNIRPYIVCCVVRNLNFNKTNNMFKRFIALQTRLHEEICQKRQLATIATHDLPAVNWPLVYDAKPPPQIKLVPLGKLKETSADKLMLRLRQEAEALRREKKRNTPSGIHKYLELLKGKPLYPCLLDKSGAVLSFPPITNSDITKIQRDTSRDILIEITSSNNLDICKSVMQEFLQQLLEMGMGSETATAAPTEEGAVPPEESGDSAAAAAAAANQRTGEHLVLQQVKVIGQEGGLRVMYPSRVDLQSEAFVIQRDED